MSVCRSICVHMHACVRVCVCGGSGRREMKWRDRLMHGQIGFTSTSHLYNLHGNTRALHSAVLCTCKVQAMLEGEIYCEKCSSSLVGVLSRCQFVYKASQNGCKGVWKCSVPFIPVISHLV